MENHKLQSGYKRVGVRIRIRPDADAHGLTLREKNPFVIRRHAVSVVLGGVDDGPEGAVHDLVEHRRRGPAVDSPVEVSGPHHVLGVAVDLDGVAVLPAGMVRERSDGGEDGEEYWNRQVLGGPAAGEEAGVGEPFAAVDLGLFGGAAIDQST